MNTHLMVAFKIATQKKKSVCLLVGVYSHCINFIFAFNENSLSLLYGSDEWAMLIFCHIFRTRAI